MMIKMLVSYIRTKWYLFLKWISPLIPPKPYLCLIFYLSNRYRPNLDNPKSFNEKIQWLKLYDHNPMYTELVDKYLVKNYISKIIWEKYVIPTLWVYDKFDDIDFDKLPNQFVLKCNHDSWSVVICRNKDTFDKKTAKKKLDKALRFNYYNEWKQWAYKNIEQKIIAEKYMVDNKNWELQDYKFMCFNWEVKCSFVCSERFNGWLKVTFFDKDWNVMPFIRHYPKSNKKIEKPKNYKQMIKIAEILSKNIPFVRIDLYEINGNIYFWEFTNYPWGWFEEFFPREWDYILGEWIKLPF